tara:strand:- start:548 stop:901 length:354 start_codon:yes stop_codon:yes gene_type:complete
MLTKIKKIEIIINMKINLDDRLVEELDSLFENERKTQTEWDVCIEDIVEEYIALQNGTWEEEYGDSYGNAANSEDDSDEIYIDLRNGTSSNGANGKYNHTITQPPFEKKNLRNRFRQ